MNFSIKISILSDTKYLAPLRGLVRAVSKVVEGQNVPEKAWQVATLCLIEAVDNAIFHAHKNKINEPIDVMLTVGDSALSISIKDQGKGLKAGFNPDQAPDLIATKGRGLYLIHELMSKVEMQKTEQGHEVLLTYYLGE